MKWIFSSTLLLFLASSIYLATTIISVSTSLSTNIESRSTRTELKPLSVGIIDSIYTSNHSIVNQNTLIAVIKDYDRESKKSLWQYEIKWRQKIVKDLVALASGPVDGENKTVQNEAIRHQVQSYVSEESELRTILSKAKKELDMATTLRAEKVIAQKDLFDAEIEYERQSAALNAYLKKQPALWAHELEQKRQEIKNFESQLEQLEASAFLYEIRAPISGTIQGMEGIYQGSAVQAGQTIGVISPDSNLIAIAYASTRDIGLLKIGQEARFQVDAFNYNYFGILTGEIESIDNDYTLINNKPFYKIRCALDDTQLHLKNGFTGNLKKGMTMTARFTIAERTIWQLLWDKMDDWFNPGAPIALK